MPAIDYFSVVRESGSSSLSLAGSLLIAHPGLLDGNFRRSVLFLSANDAEEGSFGLILNRPAGRHVSDLLSGPEFGVLAKVPVLHGGPVSPDQLVFAAFRWQPASGTMECRHHIGVEEAVSLMDDPKSQVRAFIGYAGWSKGQLEAELAHHAWMLRAPSSDVIDPAKAPSLWRDLVSEFGAMFRLIAEAPDETGRN